MQQIIKNFDFEKFSFHNNSLIEASAGTGKTHTIAILYLRLLLGINNYNYLQKLTVENILIVTFTKKAVEELRERIKNIIHDFRCACIAGYSQNVFFSTILDKISNLSLAYKQLLEAEQRINEARIFTIHSFCQHILNMYPIELNAPFQYMILEDESSLLEKSCNDFWRRYFYPLPIEIVSIIEEYWKSPKNLLIEIYPYLYNNKEINFQPILTGDILSQHKHIIDYITYVKSVWNEEQKRLFNFINYTSLNRRIYNKKNITNWFTNITLWSKNLITTSYKIPKELKYFKYTAIHNKINSQQRNEIFPCVLFKVIETLFNKTKLLKQLILNMAIRKIPEIAKHKKQSSSEISFSDLIDLLDDALCCSSKGNKLAQSIRMKYPIAIIDEFQDTDFPQYRIFKKLYPKSQKKYNLLLIGDPKQSIYSFRGADIFSYLLARKNINFRYTLNVNWRASHNMVHAINTLFQFNSSYPFVFKNIPFFPLQSAKNRKYYHLIVKNKLHPPLCFWLPAENKLSLNEYRKIMANQCAHTIYDLLYNSYCGHVWLQSGKNKKRLLKSSDIVVLVRDHNEGFLISSVLETLNITTMYCSNKKHIFKTNESLELLSILKAVLDPEDNNILRIALITKIIGYNAKNIDFINQHEDVWKKEYDEFMHYYLFWEKHGIYSMLQEILFRRSFPNNLLSITNDEQYLRNILHLGEILQEKSLELNSKHLLVRWLSIQIDSCNMHRFDEQLLRSNSNSQFIKIITIHKAKGLEFPLVFVPFIFSLHKKKYSLFHDRENYQLHLDFNNVLKNFLLSEEEQLSEDLRIFYVAITRAIYYCFVGIGAICFKKNNKKNTSDLHRTALGYLIQGGVPGDCDFLQECLKKLVTCSNGNITYNYISKNTVHYDKLLINKIMTIENNYVCKDNLSARNWKVSIDNLFRVTSYTELRHYNKFPISSNVKLEEIIKKQYIRNEKINNINTLLTPHTFPRGNIAGSLLHYLFQNWNFQTLMDREWLSLQLNRNNIDLIWLPILESWIKTIATTSLDKDGLMLSKLSPTNYYSELPFYLSVDNCVSSKLFDDICRCYDPIFRLSPTLQFPDIFGMLRGFIDLVFLWKEKYYLLDYKSNWLGETYNDYTISGMQNAMIIHQYTLQYQIYTLALHRFLRYKLVDYDYDKDFGGVYYLFLRGIDFMYPNCGVYFCRPNQLLIKKLDELLSFSPVII